MPHRKSQRGKSVWMGLLIFILIMQSLMIVPMAFAAEKAQKAASETTETGKKKVEKKTIVDDWYVFQHDMRHSGRSEFKGPLKPTVLWVIPFGQTGKPTTAMAVGKEGIAYAGVIVTPKEETSTTQSASDLAAEAIGSSGVFAFGDEKKVVWVSSEKGNVTGPLAIGKDGTIYAVIGQNLTAINKKDGSTKWTIKLNGESSGGVMLDKDETVYAGTVAGQTLYAVTKTGDVKWTFKVDGKIDSSPAIGSDGTIYFTTTDLMLYAVSSSGALKWKYKVDVAVTTDISSPVLAKDDTIYFSASRYEGTAGMELFYAFEPSGKLKWRYQTEGKKSSMPAVAEDGTLVLATTILNYTEDREFTVGDAYVIGITPDGELSWSFKSRDDDFNEPPVIDGEGNIYMSSTDGYLTCLTKNGTMRYRAKIGGKASIGPEGVLYVSANSSVAAVADKDVMKAKQPKKTEDIEVQGGLGAGSFLIYIIPVVVAIGIGFLLKSRIGVKEEDESQTAKEEEK
ncbi:MAG: PQQ-binding-like beta-propeller repeat protein [Candidatus Aquicultor sp.]|nr:PQQ-binding-like beta-propeller repeat protein [Candidatus Aquicultor sp.]